MVKYKEMFLGEEGIQYVRSCLQQGTGLCASTLKLSFINGSAFAPFSEDVTQERAKDFKRGSLTSRNNTFEWLAAHIKEFEVEKHRGSLIFQDVWSKVNDRPANNNSTRDRFYYDDNIYYFLDIRNVNPQVIKQITYSMSSYLFVSFYSRSYLPSEFLNDHILTEEFINNVAIDTVEIFVGAYDQEGLVVWRKNSNKAQLAGSHF